MEPRGFEFTPRELEINEAAERTQPNKSYEISFCHGAKWADAHPQSPWVSVKDRLPSVEKNLFGDVTHPSVIVLTASHAGGVSVNRWNGREWLYTGDVDYWMPIPAIPEEYIDKKKGCIK